MDDTFLRLKLLLGDDIEKIKNKKVLIIGLGGVGGYTVEALARLGVNSFILIDGDIVEKTNINRQIIATNKTIGYKKTEAWKERILDINPSCNIDIISNFITLDNINLLFDKKFDYLVDACDTVSIKKEIIRRCTKKDIPFITSMGMGNKLDPSKIEIIELSKTSYDPIAKTLRKMVKDERINKKVMTVCSSEAPKKVKGGTVSSNAVVPAVAGLLMADYIFKLMLKERFYES